MPKAGKTSPSARGTGSASFRPSGLLASSPLVAAKPFYEACLRRRPGRHRYHGHFDMAAYERYLSGEMTDFELSQERIDQALTHLPAVP